MKQLLLNTIYLTFLVIGALADLKAILELRGQKTDDFLI